MNKAELIDAIAQKTEMSKTQSGAALDAVLDSIAESLAKGEAVQLSGFGNFTVSLRAAREARNPATGEMVKVAAKKVPKFKPGKGLKDKVS